MKDLSQSNCDVNLIDRIVEIERLANLEPIDYEAARGPASERLGVRTSVLDNEVKKKRRELRLDNANGDDGKGRPLALPDVMPWPDEIEGDRIASALSATFKRYVRMSDAQANLCALWVLLTWTLDKFSIAPRLCGDYAEDISDFDPDMGGLINRVADNWRPLFALADLIGSDWPNRIRDACAALMPKGNGDSNDTILLADIRTIFDEKGTDRLSSEQICEALVSMEGRPWAEYGKGGKPISKNKLAYRLERFGVRPDNIRVNGHVPKGYYRHRFEEAWQLYLSPDPQDPPYEMLQRYNADGMGTSCTFQNATAKPHVAVQKCDKPPSNGHRSDVAVRKPENALARDEAADRVQKCDQCGQGGANLEVAYGTAHGFVHRGPCETAWIADRDDDLTIPAYLNRRAEAR